MKTKFEAGSFQYGKGFIRSIGRYKEVDAGWQIEMVLANNAKVYNNPQEAAIHAKKDVSQAFTKAQASGGATTVDHHLASIGYSRVEQENRKNVL